jgi:hypothetical protein
MTHHKQLGPHTHARRAEEESGSKKFHKDWRVWLVIGIMLTAMITYVLTLDDSVLPLILGQ